MPLHHLFSANENILQEEKFEEINDSINDEEIPETIMISSPDVKENEDERIIDIGACIKDSKEFQEADSTQFSILSVLGEGSFGKVFMVRKEVGVKQGECFAMKVLKKASLKVRDRLRTKMERDILAEISHPFIVKLHFAFQTEGKLFLVMDLVRGGDLFSRLSKEVMFTEQDVRFYLAEIAVALDHLHKCGIIYRDLKPENILLDVDGHVKLTDFGLCKETIFDENRTYSFCGTVEYMAPEVITRNGHGPPADWWSFAVLMYEMLSGSLPFHGPTRRETMVMILRSRIPMPYNFSNSAQNILRLFFKRNPGNRLGSVNGIDEIKIHPFFQPIDFQKLLNKEIECPFRPTIATTATMSNFFGPCQTPIQESPGVSSARTQLFKGFSFVAPLDESERMGYSKKSSKTTAEEILGFLPVRTSNVYGEYNLFEIVGEGSHSKVHRAINKTNSQTYAIKIVDVIEFNCREEIDILLRYSEHPNIVTLRDVFATPDKYYLVMEFIRGGDLFTRINRQKSYSELEAAYLMDTLVAAIAYLHKNGVVHRDLKPSNIMFQDESGKPETIRLTDFGYAKQIRAENGLLMTPCYTANYVAPEVLKKQGYDAACDIWSLGIILYTMLSGTTPYMNSEHEDPSVIFTRITQGEINLTTGIWTKVSTEAKELISSMVNVDPNARLKATDILNHPWILAKNTHPDVRLQHESWKLKDAMKLMFSAFNKNSEKNLTNIRNSTILKRRADKKNANQ